MVLPTKINNNVINGYEGERHLTKTAPFKLRCPNCTNVVDTRIEYTLKKKKAIPISLLLAPLTLCWVPLVMYKYKNATHYCRVCGAYIGFVE